MNKIWQLALGLCVVAAVLTACGSAKTDHDASGTTTTAASSTAAAATITIKGMNFGEPITVAPGATISIVNDDSVEHSVTSRTAGKFDTEVDGGEHGTLTAPTEPGTYEFYCRYHPTMKGTLTVK
jgi:plastocyanin